MDYLIFLSSIIYPKLSYDEEKKFKQRNRFITIICEKDSNFPKKRKKNQTDVKHLGTRFA